MIIASVPTAHPQNSSENPFFTPGINPTKEMNIIAIKANPINSRIFKFLSPVALLEQQRSGLVVDRMVV